MTSTKPNVGDFLPELSGPEITRHLLALYCGASNDHNPIHVDIDFARRSGYPDVFAHGSLSMAWLGSLLTNWVSQERIKDFSVRFVSITHIGDRITCRGEVTDLVEMDGERCMRLSVHASNAEGDVKVRGEALIAII